jgi:Flp pilus assembly protein TadD
MKTILWASVALAGVAVPAAAQPGPTNEPAPGYAAIKAADYAKAEREIREANVSKYDPARLINLGIVYAQTGQKDKAAKQFNRVLFQEDVEMVVAGGQTRSAHELARYALASLRN